MATAMEEREQDVTDKREAVELLQTLYSHITLLTPANNWKERTTADDAKGYYQKLAEFQFSINGKEWKIVGSYDALEQSGRYEECELCGHPDCRYMFVIAPTGNEANVAALAVVLDEDEMEKIKEGRQLSIGDICVTNFSEDENLNYNMKHYVTMMNKIRNYKILGDLPFRMEQWKKPYWMDYSINDEWYKGVSAMENGMIPSLKILNWMADVYHEVDSGELVECTCYKYSLNDKPRHVGHINSPTPPPHEKRGKKNTTLDAVI